MRTIFINGIDEEVEEFKKFFPDSKVVTPTGILKVDLIYIIEKCEEMALCPNYFKNKDCIIRYTVALMYKKKLVKLPVLEQV